MKQNTVNAIYLHGFASAFDPNNEKVAFLNTQVNLIPFSYDTCASYDENIQKMTAVIHKHDITLLVGCSLCLCAVCRGCVLFFGGGWGHT